MNVGYFIDCIAARGSTVVKKRTSRSVRRELRYFMLGIGYEDIEKLVVDFQAHCVQASVEVESVDICHA